MKAHLKNLSYVLRHKLYVFIECCRLGVPLAGIAHDLSKFLPDEWFPYTRYFYQGSLAHTGGAYDPKMGTEEFNRAWLKHQHRNPHHWQYFILVQDDDETLVLPMPDRYRREMLADWRGAGKAQGYGDNTPTWYQKHKDQMKLHPETRAWIETQIFGETHAPEIDLPGT